MSPRQRSASQCDRSDTHSTAQTGTFAQVSSVKGGRTQSNSCYTCWVWVRRSAIRPVPTYARIPLHALEAVRDGLADDDDAARAQLDEAFERIEATQPALAGYIAEVLGRQLDETALALGYFLTLAIWLSFERAHGEHLDEVSDDELSATQQLLELDEDLRRMDASEALDSDDVIAMEQPNVLWFVNEHIDATLESHAQQIDVDDVHVVYRLVLVELLALSYAVRRPEGFPVSKTELLA